MDGWNSIQQLSGEVLAAKSRPTLNASCQFALKEFITWYEIASQKAELGLQRPLRPFPCRISRTRAIPDRC